MKDKILKRASECNWTEGTAPPQTIVLRRGVGDQEQKLVISWRGDKPAEFVVKSSLRHPRFGVTTLSRPELNIDQVMILIKNPRAHLKTGKWNYDKNKVFDAGKAIARLNNNRAPGHTGKPYPKKKYKETGERAMFLRIWAKRKHVSEISGDPLIEDVNHPLWVNQFMHVLPKSLYPHYRLEEFNIMLGTKDEHFKQTNQIHKCQEDPRWDGFFMKFATLKAQYQEDFPVGKKHYDQ